MSIVAGEYVLLLLLCFSSCFTIIFFQMTIYIFIYQSLALQPCILRLNSDLLMAKNCSYYFSAIA